MFIGLSGLLHARGRHEALPPKTTREANSKADALSWCLCIYTCMHIRILLHIYSFIYLSIYLSIYPCINLSMNLSTSNYLSIHPSIHPSILLPQIPKLPSLIQPLRPKLCAGPASTSATWSSTSTGRARGDSGILSKCGPHSSIYIYIYIYMYVSLSILICITDICVYIYMCICLIIYSYV